MALYFECRHCILSAELTKTVVFFFGDFAHWELPIKQDTGAYVVIS